MTIASEHEVAMRLINTSIEEGQEDSLLTKSTGGGTQKLTIASNIAQGSSQECRSVLVIHSSENAVYMNISSEADADDFIIPQDVPIPVPVNDCSDLYFYGTDADTIRLLWRN